MSFKKLISAFSPSKQLTVSRYDWKHGNNNYAFSQKQQKKTLLASDFKAYMLCIQKTPSPKTCVQCYKGACFFKRACTLFGNSMHSFRK